MQTSFQRPASLYYCNRVRYDPFDWLAEKGLVKHTQPGGKKLGDQKVPIVVVLGSYPNIYHSSRPTGQALLFPEDCPQGSRRRKPIHAPAFLRICVRMVRNSP